MDEFAFYGEGLESLARGLTESALRFQAEVDKAVAVIAGDVFEVAKALASRHSQSIPPTMKLRMIPGAAVITAGSEDVPLAALYELGNKGTKTSARSTGVWFTHPVPHVNGWVRQRRYPFLTPAFDIDRRQITRRMHAAWDEALRPLRLREG